MLLVAALTTVVVSLPAQAAPTWLPDISDLSATGQNASTPQVATAMGAAAAAPFSSLLSDDYEGAVRWNPNSTGWAISTTRAFGSAHSAHAPSSPNNLMIYGPFDLSAATAATLSFQLWYYAPKASFPPGTPNTAGSFLGGYSTGSGFTFPYQWSGSTSGEWWPTTFDLGGWSLLGKPQVWIALGTTTFGSALYSEGAYVDDLNLTVTIPDTVPPTTTVTGVETGTWHRDAVTVGLLASDNDGGSGVVSTDYALDGAAFTPGTSIPLPAAADHSADALHTIRYRSTDAAGNVETAKTLKVGIDTRKPTTKAPRAATARRGSSVTLTYKVVEVGANGGTAKVRIKLKNPANTAVKTLKPVNKPVNTRLQWTFKVPRTWRTGTYHFYVFATDSAGNTAAKPVGVNHLYVK